MTLRTTHDIGGGDQSVLTADGIAVAVGGHVVGAGETPVTSVASLDRAGREQVSFLSSARYAGMLATTRAGVVLVSPALAESPGEVPARVIVADPHAALLSIIARLHPPRRRVPGVHATAVIGRGTRIGHEVEIGAFVRIGDGATIADRVSIGAHCDIGDGVQLGEDSELVGQVTLYPGTQIGARVRLHAGVRLGSDGFGYVFRDGQHQKIPHVGRCVIEDDVEIGANTTIDRGSIDDTVIGAGTRIDNLVHIAHNVRVGRLCLIMAQVGIAGSVRIEDGCILAGQVGVAGHHTVGAGARLAAQAGVFGDIPAGETWSGYPARPHREALRAQAALFRLSGLMRGIERLLSDKRDDSA